MKLLPILILPILGACGGSGPCSDSIILGSWKGTQSTVVFDNQCKFTDSVCAASGTYPNVTTMSGSAEIDVQTSNGLDGCLPLGKNACTYSLSTDKTTLVVNCGPGTVTYTK